MTSKLDRLSKEEREYALKILKDISNGKDDLYNNLLKEDYDEIPVDIYTFLHDDRYLGKGLTDDEGRFTLFPYWENLLIEIFPDNLKPASYNTLALTGAIGLGKSTMMVITGCYELYRMLCLKDPYIYYGIQPIDVITFALINITLDAAQGVAWSKMQNLIQMSPWFMEHGSVNRSSTSPTWIPPKGIELIYGSKPSHIIGRALFWCGQDEVSFRQNMDVEKQKAAASELVNSAAMRMQSRFMRGTVNPTLLVLASSKRTEQSFLETWIDTKKKNESKTTRVVDEPQWVIRTDKDSPHKFKVAIGNKFLPSEILPLDIREEECQSYIERGFRLLDVPIGYYENFQDDIDQALTDIAGISTSSMSNYISGERITQAKTESFVNPFTRDIIEVGNGQDDITQYSDYFDLTKVDPVMKSRPLFIHLDMSLTGDKTGVGGVWIKGLKHSQSSEDQRREMYFQLAFVVSVKAPRGHQVSFEKTRNFIYWLKDQGFNIKGITSDTFARSGVEQDFLAKGFNYSILSVDRVNSERICEPYAYLKNCIYERRILLPRKGINLLTEELVGLQRNNNSGKVDHTPQGINCFTGDTLIALVDGRTVSIKQLVDEYDEGKSNYVYSFNHNSQKIEPKLIKKAWCSGHDAHLIEVELDNSEKIRCTPEHKFMLRDGSYCEATALKEGDSLMPLYTKYSDEGLCGYRLYYEPMEDTWHYEHRQFAKDILDERYLVHHKDCNPKNNRPDNLLWMSKSEHVKIHALLSTGSYSHEANEKRRKSVSASHKRVKRDTDGWLRYYSGSIEERREKYKLHKDHEAELEEKKANLIFDINDYFGIDFNSLSDDIKARYRSKYINVLAGNNVSRDLGLSSKDKKAREYEQELEACKYFSKSIEDLDRYELHSLVLKYIFETRDGYKDHIAQKVAENHKLGVYDKAHEAISNRIWYTNGKDNIYIKDYESAPEGFYRGRTKTWKNHKVKSVRVIDDVENVYDLEIDETHNFALAAGVFVHNSKDSADAICGALFTASQHAEEYAFDFGESLESLVDFNQAADTPESYMSNFEESLKQQPTFVKNTNVFNTFNNEDDVSLDIFSGILNW